MALKFFSRNRTSRGRAECCFQVRWRVHSKAECKSTADDREVDSR